MRRDGAAIVTTVPYRDTPREGRCFHCRAMTPGACVRCAHPVCHDCQERHDAEFPHKDYTG